MGAKPGAARGPSASRAVLTPGSRNLVPTPPGSRETSSDAGVSEVRTVVLGREHEKTAWASRRAGLPSNFGSFPARLKLRQVAPLLHTGVALSVKPNLGDHGNAVCDGRFRPQVLTSFWVGVARSQLVSCAVTRIS